MHIIITHTHTRQTHIYVLLIHPTSYIDIRLSLMQFFPFFFFTKKTTKLDFSSFTQHPPQIQRKT
eukprot:UN01938